MAMHTPVEFIVEFKTPAQLGQIARATREASGAGLRGAASKANVGVRFLSEFERGKPTAEIGKIMSTLQSLGLSLAAVKSAPSTSGDNVDGGYSLQLGTEFPYDWSNRQMTEAQFIRKVLIAARFNDILKTVVHFGFPRIYRELPHLAAEASLIKVTGILNRIHQGWIRALVDTQGHHVTP